MYDILGGFLVERIFALYDSDFYYTTRFMEYFKKKRDTPFEIIVFTQLESLKEYLRSNSVNVLLLGSDLDEDEIFIKKTKYIYQLAEDQRDCKSTNSYSIYKYQPVSEVMQDILKDFRGRESRIYQETAMDCQAKILTVFSPKQRQEVLAYSLALHSILSKQRNILFINLELLPITFLAEMESDKSNLSEIIYYIKESKDINTKLKELLSPGVLSYLGGLDHAADILSMDVEDVKKLITELRKNSDYQWILFYVNSVSEALMELMIQSDALITIKGCTDYDQALYDTWLKQLQRLGKQLPIGQSFFVELSEEEYGQAPISKAQLINSKAWQSAESSITAIGLS
jgi:hypothetical protein